jgi:hypothetical protein
MGAYNQLGIIITRLDANQDTGPIGAYELVVMPMTAIGQATRVKD